MLSKLLVSSYSIVDLLMCKGIMQLALKSPKRCRQACTHWLLGIQRWTTWGSIFLWLLMLLPFFFPLSAQLNYSISGGSDRVKC